MYLSIYKAAENTKAIDAFKALGREKLDELLRLEWAWWRGETPLEVIEDWYQEHGLKWRWWGEIYVSEQPPNEKFMTVIHASGRNP